MAVSPARATAFEILLRVERDQSYAAELLHSARFAELSSADHSLATGLVMGVLRWRSWLDLQLAEASSQKLERLDKEVLAVLRLGVYQLKFLTRVPARAAIFESVELVRKARKSSAAPFVNAVLRRITRTAINETPASAESSRAASESNSRLARSLAEIEKSPDSIALARHSAHPEWLVARWAKAFGIETAQRICCFDQQPPPTSIHIYDDGCLLALEREGIKLAAGSLVSSARTVVSGDVTRTSVYRDGRIAIQDEGSQLVAMLVGRENSRGKNGRGKNDRDENDSDENGRDEPVLDCCAAPGGKTALIAHRNPGSVIVASDLHPHRARRLRDLVRSPNVRVVAADARQLPLKRRFDRILADVPCSGTGTLARNPEIKWRLKADDLDDLQSRQSAILKSALALLAPGGRLIYSTCSLEREENEAVLEVVLRKSSEFSLVDCREALEPLRQAGELRVGMVEPLLDGPYLRTIPGNHACDGFFAAIVKRK